jgi:hypothetical protein
MFLKQKARMILLGRTSPQRYVFLLSFIFISDVVAHLLHGTHLRKQGDHMGHGGAMMRVTKGLREIEWVGRDAVLSF